MNYSQQIQLEQLEKQKRTGQYLLLATVIVTVINIALLLSNASIHLPYTASPAYYLTLLGFYYDGYTADTYTATGMTMAFACLTVWLFIWWMSRTRRAWLIVGLVLVCLDLGFLLLFSLVFLGGISAGLLDGICHAIVIFQIARALSADRRLPVLRRTFEAENARMAEENPEDSLQL